MHGDATRREIAFASVGAVVLAAVTTWPLLPGLGRVVPGDLGDPLLQAWQVAWSGRAMWPGAPALLDANGWYPLPDNLAFSDPPVGYAPLAVGVGGVEDALLRYGIAFLLAASLAWIGPYLLARVLQLRPAAAAVAATAVAYAPWRLAHDGHLNILSTGGIALSLALLVHGHRRARPGAVLAGWLVAAWQVTVSIALAVPFGYFLAVVAAVTVVAWLRRGRPRVPRSLMGATVAGLVVLGMVVLWRGLPYLQVADGHPGSLRTVAHLELFSPPVRGLLAAPDRSLLWGSLTAGARDGMVWPPEQVLFPGAAVVLLAVAGTAVGAMRRSLRYGIAVGVVVVTLLALGVTVADGRWTYLPLFDHVLGWRGLRTPGRLILFVSLGLALLAASSVEAAAQHLDRRGSPRLAAGAAWAAAAVVLIEGLGTTPLPEAPEPPPLASVAAPQLHLPSAEVTDATYLLWSVGWGYPELVNGTGSFEPQILTNVRALTRTFPDAASVAYLRGLGVRTVVWHADLANGTPWADVGARADPGLGIRRRQHGGVVVFELLPP